MFGHFRHKISKLKIFENQNLKNYWLDFKNRIPENQVILHDMNYECDLISFKYLLGFF